MLHCAGLEDASVRYLVAPMSKELLGKIAGTFLKDKSKLDSIPHLAVCAALQPCKPLDLVMALSVSCGSLNALRCRTR